MARGVNKVILIGNLGNDPEVRYTPNGSAVANVSLATTAAWRDKQSGEMREQTEWHRVVFFNRLAEIVGEYLRKGSKIFIEGSLRTRKWQDKSGVERYTTEIVANEMHMLDSKGSQGAGGFNQSPSTQNYKSNAVAQQPAVESAGPTAASDDMANFDDDIPF